jgi:hypothetical protein
MMNTIICTLFEKHYHYGLAALTNSLYHHGFRGSIFAGYRGILPEWCSKAKESYSDLWPGSRTFDVAENFQIHFLPLDTDFHLTNYKPFFMLRLLETFGKDAEAVAYFDPDIVIKCQWNFFETWMSYGVALVHEITANDMPATHPIRKQWEDVIVKCNKKVTRNLQSYINGGFCGVARSNFEFLNVWMEIMNTAIAHYNLKPGKFMPSDRTHPFFASDQDALNIAAMCSECAISEIGPEGMDLTHGGWTMSHAVGLPKPWKKNFILSTFKGSPPSLADKAYWLNVDGPLHCYQSMTVKWKRISILFASFIGRFYRRY